jgi:SAM-dependent methyltransferase
MVHREQLRASFDRVAARYQGARPDYPPELYARLLDRTGLRPPAELLEIGCGPGKATLPLARMGFHITAVELGPEMAAEARRNLAEFPHVQVIAGSFDEWQPPPGRSFDLVYAATAWGWLDPATKYARAGAVLRPGGFLAVWGAGHAFPTGFDPFFTEIQDVYNEIGEDAGLWPPPPPDADPGASEEITRSECFDLIGVERYVWSLRYTAEEYISLLDTFSGHITMTPGQRDRLYSEIRLRLGARPDGRVTRHWLAVLTIGRRRP